MPRSLALSFMMALGLGLAGGATACATTSNAGFGAEDAGEGAGDGGLGDGSLLGDGAVGETSVQPGKTVFYAHTNKTLFKVDADDPTLGVERIGDFDCVGTGAGQVTSMTDIAVDREGRLYGVAEDQVFLDMGLNGGAVECAGKGVGLSSRGSFLGASFAPRGVLDPQNEVLVLADSAGDLYRVDTSSGQTAKVGNFGIVPTNDGNGNSFEWPGTRWALSGDIVFFENNGSPIGFATVRDCQNPTTGNNCSDVDTLLEIDVQKLAAANPTASVAKAVRGKTVRQNTSCTDPANPTGYGRMFGIAAVGPSIIGFSRSRSTGSTNLALVVRVSSDKGPACLVADHTQSVGGGWAGAGVTTIAPVSAPPPK